MKIIPEGGKCPKTGGYVMIRSDLGCRKCEHKLQMIGDGKNLSVQCARDQDETESNRRSSTRP